MCSVGVFGSRLFGYLHMFADIGNFACNHLPGVRKVFLSFVASNGFGSFALYLRSSQHNP